LKLSAGFADAHRFFDRSSFYWPELDVDLDLERVEHPEKFPLVAKV
jgi:hypothetical protein